ncbi:MAG TPA: PadR family transcriptional regulator [Thermoanaerobaculia bacterium]|nr:PadR family transcriptional regulator [Thermoanaerobaculia bacterium]
MEIFEEGESETPSSSRRTQVDSLQGTLGAMVLKSLSRGPLHGYAIARWIEGIAGDQLLVEEGSLYPTLRRLEQRAWVTSRWAVSETGRKVKLYRLTTDGARQLDAEVTRWRSFAAAVSRVLEEPGGAT